jgi:hypothetical protein
VTVQPITVYLFHVATNSPGMTFSNLTSMYWSLSALDCSWKMPSACSSSWIERPSLPRQLGPLLSGGSSDTIWGPPNLPTYDQHLHSNTSYYNFGTTRIHSRFSVISHVAQKRSFFCTLMSNFNFARFYRVCRKEDRLRVSENTARTEIFGHTEGGRDRSVEQTI